MAMLRDSSPMRVLICDKDSEERWLIRFYLEQGVDEEISIEETDQTSDIKSAVGRRKIDLVLVDIDECDQSGYWLQQILENQLAPVVVLSEHWTENEMDELLQQQPVGYLCKSALAREHLIDTINGTMKKWQAIKRDLAHKEELEQLLSTDSLTGLLTRRAILRRLEEAMTRARRYGEKISVLLLDIDNFRQLNNSLGRPAGDHALRRVAALLKNKMRDSDISGRYGGDEFLLILPHTDIESAQVPAERVRKLIENLEVKNALGEAGNMTVSAGLAAYAAGDDVTSMTYRAEASLCRAKQKGRNRTER